jgi:hypothetical protein
VRPGNTAIAKFTLFLEGGNGKPLPDAAFGTSVANAVTLGAAQAGPAVGVGYALTEESVPCKVQAVITTVAKSAAPSALDVNIDLTYQVSASLDTDAVVFQSADLLRVELPMTVTLIGYQEKTKKPVSVLAGLQTRTNNAIQIVSAVARRGVDPQRLGDLIVEVRASKKLVPFAQWAGGPWALEFVWDSPPPGYQVSFLNLNKDRTLSINGRLFSFLWYFETTSETQGVIKIVIIRLFTGNDPAEYRDLMPERVRLSNNGRTVQSNTVTVTK